MKNKVAHSMSTDRIDRQNEERAFIQGIEAYFNNGASERKAGVSYEVTRPFGEASYIRLKATLGENSVSFSCDGRSSEMSDGKNHYPLPEDFGNACAVIQECAQDRLSALAQAQPETQLHGAKSERFRDRGFQEGYAL